MHSTQELPTLGPYHAPIPQLFHSEFSLQRAKADTCARDTRQVSELLGKTVKRIAESESGAALSNQERLNILLADVDRKVALPAVQYATKLAESSARLNAEQRAGEAVLALLGCDPLTGQAAVSACAAIAADAAADAASQRLRDTGAYLYFIYSTFY